MFILLFYYYIHRVGGSSESLWMLKMGNRVTDMMDAKLGLLRSNTYMHGFENEAWFNFELVNGSSAGRTASLFSSRSNDDIMKSIEKESSPFKTGFMDKYKG